MRRVKRLQVGAEHAQPVVDLISELVDHTAWRYCLLNGERPRLEAVAVQLLQDTRNTQDASIESFLTQNDSSEMRAAVSTLVEWKNKWRKRKVERKE